MNCISCSSCSTSIAVWIIGGSSDVVSSGSAVQSVTMTSCQSHWSRRCSLASVLSPSSTQRSSNSWNIDCPPGEYLCFLQLETRVLDHFQLLAVWTRHQWLCGLGSIVECPPGFLAECRKRSINLDSCFVVFCVVCFFWVVFNLCIVCLLILSSVVLWNNVNGTV